MFSLLRRTRAAIIAMAAIGALLVLTPSASGADTPATITITDQASCEAVGGIWAPDVSVPIKCQLRAGHTVPTGAVVTSTAPLQIFGGAIVEVQDLTAPSVEISEFGNHLTVTGTLHVEWLTTGSPVVVNELDVRTLSAYRDARVLVTGTARFGWYAGNSIYANNFAEVLMRRLSVDTSINVSYGTTTALVAVCEFDPTRLSPASSVKKDCVGPVATVGDPDGDNGWHKSLQTVTWADQGDDGFAGVGVDAQACETSAASEGEAGELRCADLLGNTGSVTLKIDLSDPTTTLPADGVVPLAKGTPFDPDAHVIFADTVSGIDPARTGCTVTGDLGQAGDHTVDCTAVDLAGRQATASYTVRVEEDEAPDAEASFRPPINADGSSVFKQKSTVPVKVTITGTLGSAAPTFRATRVSAAAGTVNETTVVASTTTGTDFRWADGQWIYNWSTRDLATGTYTIEVLDGTTVIATTTVGLR